MHLFSIFRVVYLCTKNVKAYIKCDCLIIRVLLFLLPEYSCTLVLLDTFNPETIKSESKTVLRHSPSANFPTQYRFYGTALCDKFCSSTIQNYALAKVVTCRQKSVSYRVLYGQKSSVTYSFRGVFCRHTLILCVCNSI